MLGFAALGELSLGEASDLSGEVAGPGTFALNGQDTLRTLSIEAGTGALTLTGQTTGRALSIEAGVGAYAITGRTVSLERGYRLIASPTVLDTQEQPLFQALGVLAVGQSGSATPQATTFLFTGISAFFERDVDVFAGTGVFTLTGVDAGLVFQGYPTNIRIFPRVGRGIRSFPTGRTAASTGPLAWNGDVMFWNGEQVVWNGQASAGGIIVRTSAGRGIRARAFGG